MFRGILYLVFTEVRPTIPVHDKGHDTLTVLDKETRKSVPRKGPEFIKGVYVLV